MKELVTHQLDNIKKTQCKSLKEKDGGSNWTTTAEKSIAMYLRDPVHDIGRYIKIYHY